ncbi:pectinesterase inhibitor 10-like protein [Tanacetum coccineum]|uniref:Pectinesterase inhibitor 10-like protein n=1 Tax=Tanacetum coccineum TaxID=301880 RepID=A0ABQ4YA73_9ASTR
MNRPGSKDFMLVVSDIQTWVSSAMTDEDTCSEGFANDKKMKSVVRGKLVNVVHLTSNALALINNYASISSVHGRNFLKDLRSLISWADTASDLTSLSKCCFDVVIQTTGAGSPVVKGRSAGFIVCGFEGEPMLEGVGGYTFVYGGGIYAGSSLLSLGFVKLLFLLFVGHRDLYGFKDDWARLVMSDIQTWVSSAMTDEETCSEGFADDPKMKSVVRGKIVNVAHLTSNALALINNYASLDC